MSGTKILDLGSTTPTCVAELPAQRAMLVIQNNKMLGVLNITSEYGGSDMMGERTDISANNTGGDSMSNSQENPGFGMDGCPENNPNCQAPTGNSTAGGSTSGNSSSGDSSSGSMTSGGSTFGNMTEENSPGDNNGDNSRVEGQSEQSSSFPGGSPTGNLTNKDVSFKFLILCVFPMKIYK